MTYLFRLYDIDDAVFDLNGTPLVGMAAAEMSILHPLQGAQTTGSAASYAEKIFLRTLFKIVTGEPDADYFARPKPKRAPLRDPFADDDKGKAEPEAESTKERTPPNKKVETATKQVRAEPKPSSPYPDEEEIRIPDERNLPPANQQTKIAAKVNVLIGTLSVVDSKLSLKNWKEDETTAKWIEEAKEAGGEDYARLQEAFAGKIAELKKKAK